MRGLLGPAKLAEPVRRALGAEVQVQRQEPWEPEQQGDVIALLALIPTKRYKKSFVIKRNNKKKRSLSFNLSSFDFKYVHLASQKLKISGMKTQC